MEQRYKAVMEVLEAHVPVTEVARRHGVSRQSVHAWIRLYRSDGIEGLLDRSHRPKTIPARVAPAVEAAICELRRAHPRYGPVTLRYWLEKNGVSPLPSRTTVYRVLVRNNLITPIARKRKRDSLCALAARRLHGAVAARLHQGRLPRRWNRMQGGDRHRRPLALIASSPRWSAGRRAGRSPWPSPRP